MDPHADVYIEFKDKGMKPRRRHPFVVGIRKEGRYGS
jgi:hypothetical protein